MNCDWPSNRFYASRKWITSKHHHIRQTHSTEVNASLGYARGQPLYVIVITEGKRAVYVQLAQNSKCFIEKRGRLESMIVVAPTPCVDRRSGRKCGPRRQNRFHALEFLLHLDQAESEVRVGIPLIAASRSVRRAQFHTFVALKNISSTKQTSAPAVHVVKKFSRFGCLGELKAPPR